MEEEKEVREKRQRRDAEGAETRREEEDSPQRSRMKTEKHRTGKRNGDVELTTPDLVLLSLLAERPMHGYQANAELERRCIRDWAAISRPLVYYSLEKLAKTGMIRAAETGEPPAGPKRTSFGTTEEGRAALADALERKEWTTQREHPAFLTWLALSWQARPGVFLLQLRNRRKFLLRELAREKKTLQSIYAEVGHRYHEAVWMVGLMIQQLATEVRWTRRLERELARRANALNPAFAQGLPK